MAGPDHDTSSPGSRRAPADPVTLACDRKLWDRVSAADFSGPLFDRVVDQVVSYAIPHLRAATRSGLIFRWCTEHAAGQAWSSTGGASLGTYFLGMSIDEFPNRFRAWLRRREQSRRDTRDLSPSALTHSPDHADRVLDGIDLQDRLALAELTPNQSRAITLRAWGFSLAEIAQVLASWRLRSAW